MFQAGPLLGLQGKRRPELNGEERTESGTRGRKQRNHQDRNRLNCSGSIFRALKVFFSSLKVPTNSQGIFKMGKFSTGSARSPLTFGLSQPS